MRIGTDQATENAAIKKHSHKYATILEDGGVTATAVPTVKLTLSMTIDASGLLDKDSEQISPKECEKVADAINGKLAIMNSAFKNLSATLAEHDIDIVSKRFKLDDFLILTKERHARIRYKG